MTMYVRTSFNPIRMMAGQKEPVHLTVEIKNKDDKIRNYSLTVKSPTLFGFDEGRVFKENRARVPDVEPGKAKDVIFTIFAKTAVKPGFYNFDIVVREHDERFDRKLGEQRLTTKLRVEKDDRTITPKRETPRNLYETMTKEGY